MIILSCLLAGVDPHEAGAADPQGDQQVPRGEGLEGHGGRRRGARGVAVQGGQVAGLVLRQLRQLSLCSPICHRWLSD